MLAIGESEFTISADGEKYRRWQLDPFYLVALGEGTAYGELSYHQTLKISGICIISRYGYQLLTSVGYYPTDDR